MHRCAGLRIRLIIQVYYSHCHAPMIDRRRTPISSRKQPKQAARLNSSPRFPDAAIQVLAKEGEQRFTTARVAEKAGVRVGLLSGGVASPFRTNTDATVCRLLGAARGALKHACGAPRASRSQKITRARIQGRAGPSLAWRRCVGLDQPRVDR